MQRQSLSLIRFLENVEGFKVLDFETTEDFEGTEQLLREEIAEGWQKPKGEFE